MKDSNLRPWDFEDGHFELKVTCTSQEDLVGGTVFTWDPAYQALLFPSGRLGRVRKAYAEPATTNIGGVEVRELLPLFVS